MYEYIRTDIPYIMLYAVVASLAATASCYLLWRDGNAFAADVTPPLRLRRWAAAFLASIVMNHAWYSPIFFLDSDRDVMMTDYVGWLLDSMTVFPLAVTVVLTMLQDRRRPLWPAFAMMVPFCVGAALAVACGHYVLVSVLYGYALLMSLGIVIYMVRALRQYGRWLRDNYADLEHKEVWQSFVVLGIIMLAFAVYAFSIRGPAYQYAMQLILVVLICYLPWRVETLSELNTRACRAESDDCQDASAADNALQQAVLNNIGQLLQQRCIDTQLYLQPGLTVIQLAKAIGTNRLYLSQYFSSQGITYNAYINDLRIDHFIRLYRDAIGSQRPFTAQQLAGESGYRSYSTFGIAFKQRTGQTVTAWMRDMDK